MPCALWRWCRCYGTWPFYCVSSWSFCPQSTIVAGMYIPPSIAGSLMGSVSSTGGCKPKKSPSFRTSIKFGMHWLTCSCPCLPLTSVRHTIFQPRLVGSLERKTCWQCSGNAKKIEYTLPSIRLKLAIVKPYRSRSMFGCRGSWLGRTQSHTSTVVQWFR